LAANADRRSIFAGPNFAAISIAYGLSAGHSAACKAPSHNQEENPMHYRNGREAKNGDKIVKLNGGQIVAFGVLHSATPGNDYCNGYIAVVQQANDYACMVDCLHVDDVAELLASAELSERPKGK
jgi:hypothetical protein